MHGEACALSTFIYKETSMSAKSSRRRKQSPQLSSATRRTRPPREARNEGAGAQRPSPAPSPQDNSGSAPAPLSAFQKPQLPLLHGGFSAGGVTALPAIPGPTRPGQAPRPPNGRAPSASATRPKSGTGSSPDTATVAPAAAAASGAPLWAASAAATALADDVVPDTAPPRRPFLVHHKPAGPLQVLSWNCEALPPELPQGLSLTYWFDPALTGQPYPVSARFTGRRVAGPEAPGAPGAPDTFEHVQTLERVLPGSGPVALTARVSHLAPGQWRVTANPIASQPPSGAASQEPRRSAGLPAGEAIGTTTWLRVANERAPGVRLGAWPALVGLGAAVAMTLQAVLAAQRGLPAGRLLLISLLASLLGVAGAKVYYVITHRGQRRGPLTGGMSLQGSMIAVFGGLLLGSWLAGIPVGPMLDVTAPGLLFGLALGRWGCFFGGCCVGRPTASRWGIWSSDRWVGVRRIPVQLMESSWAGILAVAALISLLTVRPAVSGLFFVAAFAAYTFGRQVLFPLRTVPRKTAHGRMVTLMVSGLAVVAAVAVLMMS